MKVKNLTMSVITALTLLTININSAESGWEAASAGNIPNTIIEGEKFADAVNYYGNGWSNKFGYSEDLAWEQDFKDPDMGGDDNNYIDSVDLALFSGHGSQNSFYLATEMDDPHLSYNDAKWGNNYNLEWIIIDACNVLDNRDGGLINRWATPTVFNGLHYIFGYVTTTLDVDSRGEDFVKYGMRDNLSVRDAWYHATIVSENGTIAASLWAEGANSNTSNDHLWNHGYTSPDPTGSLTFWYSTWGT